MPGPEAGAKSKLDPTAFIGMIDRVQERFPHIKVIATTLREVHSTNRHTWAAVAWIDGRPYVSPSHDLDVHDRVGGGDGFFSGFVMACSQASRRKMQLSWVGLTARCSPLSPAIPPWRPWHKCGPLRWALQLASSADGQFFRIQTRSTRSVLRVTAITGRECRPWNRRVLKATDSARHLQALIGSIA